MDSEHADTQWSVPGLYYSERGESHDKTRPLHRLIMLSKGVSHEHTHIQNTGTNAGMPSPKCPTFNMKIH